MRIKIFLLSALCFLIAGCSETPVAEEVSQTQANAIVSALSENGISAEASRGSNRGKYSVVVSRDAYLSAVGVLHSLGLPIQEDLSFSEAVASSGFLPSSNNIEALRFDRALAASLEELLSAHPAVTPVKSIVHTSHSGQSSAPGVSVLIQKKEGLAIDRNEILGLITKVIPNISQESVSLVIQSVDARREISHSEAVDNKDGAVNRIPLSEFLYLWKIPESQKNSLSVLFLICLGAMGLVGFLGGFIFYSMKNKNAPRRNVDSRGRKID